MGAPAFEIPRNEQPPVMPPEGEAALRPELRLVTPEMSPAEAEGALMETASEMKDEAAQDTKELTQGTQAQMLDIGARYNAPPTAEEAAASAALTEKAKALEQNLQAEVAAVTGEAAPSVAGPDLRFIQGQAYRDELSYLNKELEQAERQKNGPLADALFARRRELLDSNTRSTEVPKEASPATEKPAEEARDFATVEAEFVALDQQIEAADKKGDRSLVAQLSARHAEVGAERKQMMAEQKAAAEKAKAEQAPVAVAETPAAEQPVDEKTAKIQQLEAQMRDLEGQRASLQGSEDTWAPDKKKAVEGQLETATAEWQDLRKEAEEGAEDAEEEEKVPETDPEAAKKTRILQLEAKMRELEKQFKEAGSPDAKAAIGRQLEATTREWDILRAEVTGRGNEAVVEQAAVMAAAAETLAETADKPEEEKTPEEKKKEEAAQTVVATASLSKLASSGGGSYEGGGSSGGGGGGGGGKEKVTLGKKLEDAWGWAQKFFGGWTGIK